MEGPKFAMPADKATETASKTPGERPLSPEQRNDTIKAPPAVSTVEQTVTESYKSEVSQNWPVASEKPGEPLENSMAQKEAQPLFTGLGTFSPANILDEGEKRARKPSKTAVPNLTEDGKPKTPKNNGVRKDSQQADGHGSVATSVSTFLFFIFHFGLQSLDTPNTNQKRASPAGTFK
jgi:hypothetical protein